MRGLTLVGIAGSWLVGMLLDSLLPLPPLALLIDLGAASIFFALLWHDRQGRFVMGLVLCLLLGGLRFSLASPLNDPHSIARLLNTNSLTIDGIVSDEPKSEGRSRVLIISADKMSTDNGKSWQITDGRLEVRELENGADNPYGANYGDTVELKGKLQAPQQSPPDILATMAFPRVSVTSRNTNLIIAALYRLRTALAIAIERAMPEPAAALLIAILLSLHTPALKPLVPIFNVTGTAHLIAPSGFKVTVLAGLVVSATSWLHKRPAADQFLLPAQKRGGWKAWLITVGTLLCIGSYTMLSGAGPAAVRSGIMGSLLIVAPRLGRRYNIYTALALTALLMSLINPFVIWDVGFQLSFLGTCGIVILTPFFQHLLRPLERLPLGEHISTISAVTLAAQIATMPILAVNFQTISFIAPLANILTVPLLGAFIALGCCIGIAGLISGPLAMACSWAAWPLLWYMITITTWCANLPLAYLAASNINGITAWSYYILLALLTLFIVRKWPALTTYTSSVAQHASLLHLSPRSWRLVQLGIALSMVLATGIGMLTFSPGAQLTISFLSVGPAKQAPQGEAILIRTPDDRAVLIDGGPDITSLAQGLDSRLAIWQRSLNTIVLTTPRPDHLTGLQDIVQRYQINTAIDAGMLHPNIAYTLWRRSLEQHGIPYKPVAQGAAITQGSELTFQVLWPPSQLHKSSREAFDNGLILRLITPHLRILFLGVTSLSQYALMGLLQSCGPGYLQADVVQLVSEQGKAFPATLPILLKLAHPTLVVVTPSTLSKQLNKSSQANVIPLSSSLAGPWKTMQTAQTGTLEIISTPERWTTTYASL
ncbi:DUF4131 domain-containing protein [Ktedonosporobacter rubrisoli]|uniref:DUF4131 domain-containing protein n=1 Tax=Ktedonosporobacter rubrisoli TaxID=2509675 RepID=A0A4P6JT73_KTERU|nr:ComEC/Rec2 family competence protein [Ktedonosporobacter rubrisoli]QBD78505.1 DUF4131 domain-containing protein [Ktedonosporobacter rubrisoli]